MAHDDHDHPHGHGHAHDHDHDHDHAHPHDHAHGHDHDHPHAGPDDEPMRRAPLDEGAGRDRVLFFDAFSGTAGDMTIAALLDLGVPMLVVERAVAALPIDGFHLHRGHASRSGIVATTFDVHVEGPQPERTWGAIDAMLSASALAPRVRELARAIFRRLGEAEANVHRTPIESVHFHEVGAVDAIVDVVGSAACLAWLAPSEIVATPLPMSRGFVRARHGVLPLPAPAVVDCLRGVPTYAVDVDAELVTPTGAAIVATVATRFAAWPSFAPERTGWGAGQRELADRPNVLRAVLGRASDAAVAPGDATHVVLEANVDDMTGELAGHAIAALLAAGALDAWVTPITMKKGRPALTLAALAAVGAADRVAETMLRESTSLGVRWTRVTRTERPRRVVEVSTRYGVVPVKVGEGPFGPEVAKPEFDACARVAAAAGVPVREVLTAALEAWGRRRG